MVLILLIFQIGELNILNEDLVFKVGESKVKIIEIKYLGPPLKGYEHTTPKIIGKVKNIGENVVVGLRVLVTIYERGYKKLIDKREREVAFLIMRKGEIAPFCISLEGGVHSYKQIRGVKLAVKVLTALRELLKIKGEKDFQKRYYKFLKPIKIGLDIDTTIIKDKIIITPYIHGKLVNTGNKEIYFNVVVVVFYDMNGNLIDYTKHNVFTELGGEKFGPQEVKTFRLDVPKKVREHREYKYRVKVLSLVE
jgi:hypothetical protein